VTLELDDPRHGTYGGYKRHRCRCVACTEANRERSRNYYRQHLATSTRIGDKRRTQILLHCDTCPYTAETAVDMHAHCWMQHGRMLTKAERTPRHDA
jgi:hypothetical protein